MSAAAGSTIHASCVLIGRNAVLIRGPSGAGKSSLALALLDAAHAGKIPPSRLVADDRVLLEAAHGRLLARAPETIRGKIEIRGIGIRTISCEPLARISLVVDLAADDAARMPEAAATEVEVLGVKLSRLPIRRQEPALSAVLATFGTVAKG